MMMTKRYLRPLKIPSLITAMLSDSIPAEALKKKRFKVCRAFSVL
jgi:hypothetical protein